MEKSKRSLIFTEPLILREIWTSLFLFSFAVLVGLIFVQVGSSYSGDGARYYQAVQQFIRFDYQTSHLPYPDFPYQYSVLATPGVLIGEALGFDPVFAFRFLNILAFAFSTMLIYQITRLLKVRWKNAMIAAAIFSLGTSALPISLDFWPQNFSVALETGIILFALWDCRTPNALALFLQGSFVVLLFFLRPFELLFIFPWIGWTLIRRLNIFICSSKTQRKKIIRETLTIFFFVLILFLPLMAFNLKNSNNLLGYYTTPQSAKAHTFDVRRLKDSLPQLVYHFTMDSPDLHAHRAMLSLLEGSPVLLCALLGFFAIRRHHSLPLLFLSWTIFSGLFFYGSFIFWSDPFSQGLRFLLSIVPSFILLSIIGFQNVMGSSAFGKAEQTGGAFFVVGWLGLAYAFFPFFQKMVLTNISIWNNRPDYKTLGLVLVHQGLVLLSAAFLFLILKKEILFRWILGMIRGWIGVGLLHSFLVYVLSLALSIRIGDQVFPLTRHPWLLNHFGVEVISRIPLLLWLVFLFFAYLMGRSLFRMIELRRLSA